MRQGDFMGSKKDTQKRVSQSVLESQINAEPSHPSTGGTVTPHKLAADQGPKYPGPQPPQQNQHEFDAKEDKGAARRALDKQIGDTARPALSEKEYDDTKYSEHQ
jgi:hypothetical protein